MVNYYIASIKGAQSHYNLTIDYISGRNEHGYNKQFYEALKSALQANGLPTKVVAADSGWDVVDAMVSENGAQDENRWAFAMACAINRRYIDSLMTAYINWPLIAAICPNLPFAMVGLMVANQPW